MSGLPARSRQAGRFWLAHQEVHFTAWKLRKGVLVITINVMFVLVAIAMAFVGSGVTSLALFFWQEGIELESIIVDSLFLAGWEWKLWAIIALIVGVLSGTALSVLALSSWTLLVCLSALIAAIVRVCIDRFLR